MYLFADVLLLLALRLGAGTLQISPLSSSVQVLHCTVLHCTALYCTALYGTVLYCTVIHHVSRVLAAKQPKLSQLSCTSPAAAATGSAWRLETYKTSSKHSQTTAILFHMSTRKWEHKYHIEPYSPQLLYTDIYTYSYLTQLIIIKVYFFILPR